MRVSVCQKRTQYEVQKVSVCQTLRSETLSFTADSASRRLGLAEPMSPKSNGTAEIRREQAGSRRQEAPHKTFFLVSPNTPRCFPETRTKPLPQAPPSPSRRWHRRRRRRRSGTPRRGRRWWRGSPASGSPPPARPASPSSSTSACPRSPSTSTSTPASPTPVSPRLRLLRASVSSRGLCELRSL